MSQGVRRDVVDGVGYDVLASIDIPIVVVDDDRRIRQFNPKAAAVMRLRESDVGRLINDAVTSLSDELRTPLSAILLWTDVLRGLEQDDPHRAVAIDTIDECARAEARLVDDVLDLAMSASGELAIEARPVEAEPIVRDAIESIVPIAAERRINLVAALDGSGAHIWADPRRLHQVVKKLLINAVEFTVEGSDIHISLKQIGRALQLRLVDRGPGIDADFLPRVFEPFAQQDTSTARAHRGLGIGLALVRYLVERQAGTIDVESSDGQGTTFIVRFPVTASRA
jgi:signal transduction histidine kinase